MSENLSSEVSFIQGVRVSSTSVQAVSSNTSPMSITTGGFHLTKEPTITSPSKHFRAGIEMASGGSIQLTADGHVVGTLTISSGVQVLDFFIWYDTPSTQLSYMITSSAGQSDLGVLTAGTSALLFDVDIPWILGNASMSATPVTPHSFVAVQA